jgi:hypothetical protein
MVDLAHIEPWQKVSFGQTFTLSILTTHSVCLEDTKNAA